MSMHSCPDCGSNDWDKPGIVPGLRKEIATLREQLRAIFDARGTKLCGIAELDGAIDKAMVAGNAYPEPRAAGGVSAATPAP